MDQNAPSGEITLSQMQASSPPVYSAQPVPAPVTSQPATTYVQNPYAQQNPQQIQSYGQNPYARQNMQQNPYVQNPYAAQEAKAVPIGGGAIAVAVPVGQQYPAPGAQGAGPRWFKDGICDCLTNNLCPSCGMALCCPCFTFARIKTSEDIEGCPGNNYWANCCLYFTALFLSGITGEGIFVLLTLFGTIVRVMMLCNLRYKYRQAKNYHGSQLEDCCCSLCCPCCTISQIARDNSNYNEYIGCDCNTEFCPPEPTGRNAV